MVNARSTPWTHDTVQLTKRWLESDALKIVHNGMFDVPRLLDAGVLVRGPFWDTLWGAQLVDPDAPGFSLNELASFYLDTKRWKHLGQERYRPKRPKFQSWKRGTPCKICETPVLYGTKVKKQRTCSTCAEAQFQQHLRDFETNDELYNRRDSAHLVEIQAIQEDELRRSGQLDLFRSMMDVFPLLIEMHLDGLRVDLPTRDRVARRMQRWATWADHEWRDASGLSPGAFAKIITLLYETWKLPPQYKLEKEGGRLVKKLTSDEEAIHNLLQLRGAHRRELKMLGWARHFNKWVKTYTEIGDRIHPSYAPGAKDADGKRFSAGAATGRLIAKGGNFRGKATPPLQQLPKPVRRMFVPEQDHVFVECDDSSQELRIAAYYYYDPELIKRIESGFDIHAENMKRWKVDRVRAKNGFYGAIYGSTGHGIQRAMKSQGFEVSLAFCKDLVGDLRSQYPGIFRRQEETFKIARDQRFLTNPFGRRRYFWAPDRSRNEILNFPIQSIGADMLWRRLPQVFRLAKSHGGMVKAAVHDSLLVSIPRDALHVFVRALRPVMEQRFPEVHPDFRVPIDIKVGVSWGPGLRPWEDDNDLSSLRKPLLRRTRESSVSE